MTQDTNHPQSVESFENALRTDLTDHLRHKGLLDPIVPQCPDVEAMFDTLLRAYLPDGAREFAQYPTASLGWMMFIGMAMARYWDSDWEHYAGRVDIYEELRDMRGFDELDEAVTESVLGQDADTASATRDLVADCAARAYNLLRHQPVEPGTPEAFAHYTAALRQLYLAGMALTLNALGYHMAPMSLN